MMFDADERGRQYPALADLTPPCTWGVTLKKTTQNNGFFVSAVLEKMAPIDRTKCVQKNESIQQQKAPSTLFARVKDSEPTAKTNSGKFDKCGIFNKVNS